MLILMRYPDESLHIGDDVIISVLGVQGHQVRLGIQAPLQVDVYRDEVYRRIQKEKNARAPDAPGPSVAVRPRRRQHRD